MEVPTTDTTDPSRRLSNITVSSLAVSEADDHQQGNNEQPVTMTATPITKRFQSLVHGVQSLRRYSAAEASVVLRTDSSSAINYYTIEGNKELQPPVTRADEEIPSRFINHERTFGFDFNNRYNLVFFPDGDRFAYAAGQFVKMYIYDISMEFHTGDRYPIPLYKVLRRGTERGYASVDFSPHDTNQLCTLGCSTDYMLSIWDWQKEKVLLRCKAFGQEVLRCVWGRDLLGTLKVLGVGHIRFWKMAETFTGLKLQGDIGKFGQAELSDIEAYAQLPDGKVVTGSEYGKLLLWEGVFVKCEMVRKPECGFTNDGTSECATCHNGPIGVVFLADLITTTTKDEESAAITSVVITAGHDGYIRWWSFEDIDMAESPDEVDCTDVGITMLKELRVPAYGSTTPPACIQHIERSSPEDIPTKWLVQDSRNGAVWLIKFTDTQMPEILQVLRAPAGPLASGIGIIMDTYHEQLTSSAAIVGGEEDGLIRAYNITIDTSTMSEDFHYELRYDDDDDEVIKVTSMAMVSANDIIVGYEDGTVRCLALTSEGFVLCGSWKPHSNVSVDMILKSEDLLITISKADSTPFLFRITKEGPSTASTLNPLGFIQVGAKIRNMKRRQEEEEEAERKANEREIEGKEEEEADDGDENQQQQDQDDDDDDEVEDDVSKEGYITSCCLSKSSILLAGVGYYGGYLWELDDVQDEEARPKLGLIQDAQPVLMMWSPSENYLIIGYNNGRVWLILEASRLLEGQRREGKSGSMMIGDMMFPAPESTLRCDLPPLVSSTCWEGLPPKATSVPERVEVVITTRGHYSLEEEKLKAEEERARAVAEKHKEGVRKEVVVLRQELEEIKSDFYKKVEGANLQPLSVKEATTLFTVDDEYVHSLRRDIDATVEGVRVEMAYDIEKSLLGVSKLKEHFLKGLECDQSIQVSSFGSHLARVGTFRLQILPKQFHHELARLRGMEDSVDVIEETEEKYTDDEEQEQQQQKGLLTAVLKREMRRAKREERRRRLQEVRDARPDDSIDNEKDVEAIAEAKASIGNHMLKLSPQYKLPERSDEY
ncbi:wd-repeat protein, putative [Perkinsus marinus ATCC 50983]|uniref:Wd-repeat protein, putative n=1 Tax=Perkinsus marinus (strain ATCC 50983 / TXsc) TaxID=423536 RepID=C5KFT2_PERM5|nr:wd-repeat protein, putative [Perkinsus marinus ATCC 50983]EER16634.1 wd-repeat protein, putative [Perkinsus marinus ATCC 50983]|eukprot:XP_002784838.1 wd-repeat protein, putative [Perkinsus marinus ATCC 50983]